MNASIHIKQSNSFSYIHCLYSFSDMLTVFFVTCKMWCIIKLESWHSWLNEFQVVKRNVVFDSLAKTHMEQKLRHCKFPNSLGRPVDSWTCHIKVSAKSRVLCHGFNSDMAFKMSSFSVGLLPQRGFSDLSQSTF